MDQHELSRQIGDHCIKTFIGNFTDKLAEGVKN
jgi:hypothetical protein